MSAVLQHKSRKLKVSGEDSCIRADKRLTWNPAGGCSYLQWRPTRSERLSKKPTPETSSCCPNLKKPKAVFHQKTPPVIISAESRCVSLTGGAPTCVSFDDSEKASEMFSQRNVSSFMYLGVFMGSTGAEGEEIRPQTVVLIPFRTETISDFIIVHCRMNWNRLRRTRETNSRSSADQSSTSQFSFSALYCKT